jgi:chromosome segregation ATPase
MAVSTYEYILYIYINIDIMLGRCVRLLILYTSSAKTSQQQNPRLPMQTSMSARKRAQPESRSRGHSPPNKRSAIEQPNHPASPPRSRTGSAAGLSNNLHGGPVDRRVMNGATRALEDHRASATYSSLQAQSPSGGSGASTPLHNAPPAPSMLPRAAGNGSADKAPAIPLASFQALKKKKQAKVQDKSAAAILSLSDQLKARETENLQLKEKLQALEHLPTKIKQLEDRLNQAPDHSQTLKELQTRLDQSPDYSDSIVGLKREMLKLEGVSKSLKELETALKKHSVQLSTDEELKNDILKLRQWQEAKHEDIKTLTSGFNVLDAFKTRMEKQNTVEQMQKMSIKIKKIDEDEERTHALLQQHTQDFERYFGSLSAAKKEFAKHDQTLLVRVEKFATLAGQIRSCQSQTSTVAREMEGFQRKMGQVQDEQKRLMAGQDTLCAEKNALKGRVDMLEFKTKDPGPGFSKVGTAVPSSTGQTLDDATAKQLKVLSEGVKGLQSAATDTKALATQITDINEQLDLLKERTHKIVTVEQKTLSIAQNVESLQDRISSFDRVAADVKEVQTKVATLADLRSKLADVDIRVHSSSVEKDKLVSVDELNELRKEFSNIETRLRNSATANARMASVNDLEVLRKELSDLNIHLQNGAAAIENAASAKDLDDIRKDLSGLAHRISGNFSDSSNMPSSEEITTLKSQIAGLNADIQSQDEALQGAEKRIHIHDQKIGILQNKVPALFTENLEPFKRTVDQQLEVVSRTVDELSGEINELKQQPSRAHTSVDTNTVEQLTQNLKQEMVQFTTKITNEVALCEQGIASHKDTTTNAVDSISLAFRSLQDQYNNINTDVLHGKMVQWFLQAYPSNAANMVQQFASLQRDVQNLQNSTKWITSQSQLSDTKVVEASHNAEQALAKAAAAEQIVAQKAPLIQSIQNALSGIQESLNNLNSASSPFVRVASNEFQDLKNTQLRLEAYIDEHETVLSALRADMTKIDNFLKTNQEALGMYPASLEVLSNVQAVVGDLCERCSLQIDWNRPIPAQLQEQQNGYADTTSGARQGKSKR